MGWAHKHSEFDKCQLGLPNVRHGTAKEIYRILSMGNIGWAHKHSDFDICKSELPNVRHGTAKEIYRILSMEADGLGTQAQWFWQIHNGAPQD